MRNPLESWEKSDSYYGCYDQIDMPCCCVKCKNTLHCNLYKKNFILGKNDIELAQKLIKAGTDHSKFMRQISVCCDITAPLYWWSEFDTYKVGTVANSTSFMHKGISKPFNISMFEVDSATTENFINYIIKEMNYLRDQYLQENDQSKKNILWKSILQLRPSSWLQTRTVTMSYQNIRQMYLTRKNHKLKNEWVECFCHTFVKTLPYADKLICLE